MGNLTIPVIQDAVKDSSSWNEFRQHIMHALGEETDTDRAIEARTESRKSALEKQLAKFKKGGK